ARGRGPDLLRALRARRRAGGRRTHEGTAGERERVSTRVWVAVAIAVVVALAAGGLLVALGALMRTMTALQLTIEELRRETLPLVNEVQGTVRQANADLVRV